jgi:hypothetical protein
MVRFQLWVKVTQVPEVWASVGFMFQPMLQPPEPAQGSVSLTLTPFLSTKKTCPLVGQPRTVVPALLKATSHSEAVFWSLHQVTLKEKFCPGKGLAGEIP